MTIKITTRDASLTVGTAANTRARTADVYPVALQGMIVGIQTLRVSTMNCTVKTCTAQRKSLQYVPVAIMNFAPSVWERL